MHETYRIGDLPFGQKDSTAADELMSQESFEGGLNSKIVDMHAANKLETSVVKRRLI